MKRLFILIILLLFTGCGANPQPVIEEPQAESYASSSEAPSPHSIEHEEEKDDPTVFKPEKNMTPEGIVEAFLEQQYISYTTFTDIDLSAIIDMQAMSNQRMSDWSKLLTQRRKIIAENGFCYVETEKFPYTVIYEDEADDQRMKEWNKWLDNPKNMVIHFRVKGEEGKAYPPVMAVNSLHSILLKRIDGTWKIAMHYFPGSRRKYGMGTIVIPPEEEMLAGLELEFAAVSGSAPTETSGDWREYDANAAVEYAKKYTEAKNPDFYDIGDWIGNCANFVSQSVWAGFGADKMTSEWYDGSPAWNHVGYFWEYITSGRGLGGQQLEGISEVKAGDIIQTRSMLTEDEPNRFTHELIVVEEETLKLAQNTPGAFVYYSDLVNVQTRIIRPVYMR